MLHVAVIMAGGSGERFWPVSRANRPKQLLRLVNPDRSMLQEALDHVTPLIPPRQVYVQTSGELADAIRRETPELPPDNILVEPCRRNTAGCLCYAAASLLARHAAPPDQLVMAVLTADHAVRDADGFRRTLAAAVKAAEGTDTLVTIGIPPTHPSTGYGYIQTDTKPGQLSTARVLAFHEKPDLPTAERYITAGGYFWNSGMFFWRLDVFLRELEAAAPEHARAVREMAAALRQNDRNTAAELFSRLPSISIDYALMEKTRRVSMILAAFDWDDVGSWPALARLRGADKHGNVTQGDPLLADCKDCVVYHEAGGDDRAVAVLGAKDLVVVVTPDAVLVMPKDRAEELRTVIEQLRKRGAKQL